MMFLLSREFVPNDKHLIKVFFINTIPPLIYLMASRQGRTLNHTGIYLVYNKRGEIDCTGDLAIFRTKQIRWIIPR